MPAPLTLEQAELETLLQHYAHGSLLDYAFREADAAAASWDVRTTTGSWVLTVGRDSGSTALPFPFELALFLARHGIPAPAPIVDRHGERLLRLGAHAAVLTAAPHGAPVASPSAGQCRAVGELLGRLHGLDHFPWRDNPRDARWARAQAEQWLERLNEEDARLLREELRFQALFRLADLPRGPIHGAPTPAHILFEGETLSALLGLQHACHDVLLYDLAAAANAWCSREDGTLDGARARALVEAYQESRPIAPIERGAWPFLLRAAALRAWLALLEGAEHAPTGPAVERAGDILRRRIAVREPLPAR